MSSSVCQGLQTCLEPRTAEPRVLRLKLAPPGSSSGAGKGNDTTGFSFLQCLDGVSAGNNENATAEKEYVHPLAKRSAAKLSAASLAMCTESLGSETGSESGGEDINLLSLEGSCRRASASPARSGSMTVKKQRRVDTVAFPPPLTSISGSGGVRVRPHREDGRLILKAVNVSPASTNLHTERSHGRLRIRLMTESSPDSASEQETEEAERETEHETEFIEKDDSISENGDDGDEDIDEEGEYDEDDMVEEEEEEDEVCRGGHNGKNCGNFGGEVGIESFRRARIGRCKEGGGHGSKNWESHFGWLLKPICLS